MNVVDRFVAQGGSVCPFARGSARLYVTVGRVPADKRKNLREAFQRFSAGQNQAVLVIGPEFADFATTRGWAREVFLELLICLGVLDGVPEKEVARYAKTEIRPLLCDDKDPRRPLLGFRGKPLYSICMAPLYPKTHPRYAPKPVIVVTWGEDVAKVHGLPSTNGIREAMRREHGFVYDADDLMLPLPTGEGR
jgi:hypothetical protein